MWNAAWVSKYPVRIHLWDTKMRQYKKTTLKIMQTALKAVSHLPLLCTHLYSVDFCILLVHCIIVLHTTSFGFHTFTNDQVLQINPKMMSDLILLLHKDLPPVILVLVSWFLLLPYFWCLFCLFDFNHISEPRSFHFSQSYTPHRWYHWWIVLVQNCC